MPVTPEVARPIGRSASSVAVNRTDCALARDQQQVVVGRDQPRRAARRRRRSSSSRRLIAMTPPERFESYSVSRVFFTRPRRVASTRYGRLLVVADVEDLGDLLVGLEGQQVGDVLAPGVAAGVGQLVGLGPVDPALVGEEQQPVVGRRDEEVVDDVVAAQLRAAHALAAAPLRAVVVDLGALGVAAAGDRDDDVLLGDEVLDRHVAVEGHDLGAPLVAELVDDLGQLLADDRALPLGRGEDRVVLVDLAPAARRARSMIFWRSRAASRRSCMSRIALAWISSISSSSIRPVAGVVDAWRCAGSAR